MPTGPSTHARDDGNDHRLKLNGEWRSWTSCDIPPRVTLSIFTPQSRPTFLVMEEQVNNFRWIPFVAAILLAVLVGAFAYNAGLAHGITQSGKIVVAPGSPAAVPYPYAYPYYGWHAWGG